MKKAKINSKKGLPIIVIFLIHFSYKLYPLDNLFYNQIQETSISILGLYIALILGLIFCCSIITDIMKSKPIYKISLIYLLLNSLGILLKYILEKYLFESGGTFNKELFNLKTIISFITILSIMQIIISIIIIKYRLMKQKE